MTGILAVSFLYNTALFMLQTLTPLFLHDSGLNPAALGALIAFPSVFQIVLRIPGGVAADRWGERIVLGGSALLMALAAPMYITGSLGWIIAAQTLTGLSRAVFWPSSQSYVTKMRGAAVGRRLGMYNTFVGAGNIVGPIIAGVSIGAIGYGGAFAILGAAGSACLAAVLLTPPPAGNTAADAPSQQSKPRGRTLSQLIKIRPLVMAALCQWAAAVPMAAIGSFLPVYLREVGMASGRIGVLSGMRGLCIVVASLFFAWGFDKLPRPLVWLTGMAAAGVGLVGVPLLVSFAPLAVCVALMGLASSSLQMLSLALVSEHTLPGERGLVMAATGTLWGASLFVHPLLFGLVAQRAATGLAFYVAGLPLLAFAAATIPMFRWAYRGASSTSSISSTSSPVQQQQPGDLTA